jgi:hypothetical protein
MINEVYGTLCHVSQDLQVDAQTSRRYGPWG